MPVRYLISIIPIYHFHPPKRVAVSLPKPQRASEQFATLEPANQSRHLTRTAATTSLYTPTPYPEQSHTDVDTMAAAIKALNAKIRANPVADYFCSTR